MSIDPFDLALSEFIDSLPEAPSAAATLLRDSAPFQGSGDLPALAEFATTLRAVPPFEPSAEWLAASKARLMAAPVLPPEKRGFTWLGSMFLPLTQITWPSLPALPSLPRLAPGSLVGRAALAFSVLLALASVAHSRRPANPLAQITSEQAAPPAQQAERAITLAEQEVTDLQQRQPESEVAGVYIKGTPKDVKLLAQYFAQAETAIQQAPPAQQPALRAQLQQVVRAVRFDGLVDSVSGGTAQIGGVQLAVDPSLAQQLKIGQTVSVVVQVEAGGKLQAVQLAPPASPPPSPGFNQGKAQASQSSQGATTSAAAVAATINQGVSPTASSAAAPDATGATGKATANGKSGEGKNRDGDSGGRGRGGNDAGSVAGVGNSSTVSGSDDVSSVSSSWNSVGPSGDSSTLNSGSPSSGDTSTVGSSGHTSGLSGDSSIVSGNASSGNGLGASIANAGNASANGSVRNATSAWASNSARGSSDNSSGTRGSSSGNSLGAPAGTGANGSDASATGVNFFNQAGQGKASASSSENRGAPSGFSINAKSTQPPPGSNGDAGNGSGHGKDGSAAPATAANAAPSQSPSPAPSPSIQAQASAHSDREFAQQVIAQVQQVVNQEQAKHDVPAPQQDGRRGKDKKDR